MVRNCLGIYTIRDVADYFGIDPRAISDIYAWQPDCPCVVSTVPNIFGTKVTDDLIVADAQILANRGYALWEIADHFGISTNQVRDAHTRMGRRLILHPHFEAGYRKSANGARTGNLAVEGEPVHELVMFG